MYSKTCISCQRTSLKRWFGNRTMKSNCDVTNSAQQIQMSDDYPMSLNETPPKKIFCVRHCRFPTPALLRNKVAVRLRLPPDRTRSYGIIDTKQQPQQNQLCCLSAQIVSFSLYLCSRRDARVNKPMTKEQEKLQAKLKYICIEQNRKYLYSVPNQQ